MSCLSIAQNARHGSLCLQSLSPADKNLVLSRLKSKLFDASSLAKDANDQDLHSAKVQVQNGTLSSSLYKRLDLFGEADRKFTSLLDGIDDIIAMPDPIGRVTLATKLDDNLDLYRVVCPVGSILVIFEARPEVLIQISCLCIKSGNSVILKGGKEAIRTLEILHKVVQEALKESNIPETAVQLITSRDEVSELLSMDKYIDLVIPRGSKKLVSSVKKKSKIPVLGHADGLCSIFVDETADVEKTLKIVVDAKTDYPAACNAVETILIHEKASGLLNKLVQALLEQHVEVRVDVSCLNSLTSSLKGRVEQADDKDFDTEFCDLIVAVKIVDSLDTAIDHINEHGSRHTDCIVTESEDNARKFMNRVDSAGVYWNASTRFADGYRYGFGAEIGVSTNKTHARGPVGLEGLTIYKYQVYGDGHAAGSYGPGKKKYLHQPIYWSK